MFICSKNQVDVLLDAAQWLKPEVDLLACDHRVHLAEDGAGPGERVCVRVQGDTALLARACAEVALRYQRLSPRRNSFSRGALFGEICQRHRALHPLRKPLVRADYEHAVDVWQWLLRLAPEASLELQIAGLFHDIERLDSESEVRIEQRAPDYLAYKLEHARRGALMVRRVLEGLPLARSCVERVEELVSQHEQPRDDMELALLNDADALSFFGLNSPGFVRYYDEAHSAKKVAYTLSRMSPAARAWLPSIRLESKVSALLAQAQAQQ